MKIVIILLLIVQIFIYTPQITLAQSEAETGILTFRTIVPPAMATVDQTTRDEFYQDQSLPPEIAFGLTVMGIVFLVLGFAILKIKTFSEHTDRFSGNNKYEYAQQL